MCSMAALPGGKRQNVYNRLCKWREKEKVVGYGSMSLPVDSSHKATLPSLPLESTYCDREINMSFTYTL